MTRELVDRLNSADAGVQVVVGVSGSG
ncbi:hypothetical protein, partial [Streptosporangium sp. NPDC048865]